MKANKENQGFKLLEEDCLDDRPCAAVKKFVASVLDKKDLKDQDVAASFRNVSTIHLSCTCSSLCGTAYGWVDG